METLVVLIYTFEFYISTNSTFYRISIDSSLYILYKSMRSSCRIQIHKAKRFHNVSLLLLFERELSMQLLWTELDEWTPRYTVIRAMQEILWKPERVSWVYLVVWSMLCPNPGKHDSVHMTMVLFRQFHMAERWSQSSVISHQQCICIKWTSL